MMEIIGSTGVAFLLGAFFANLMGWLATSQKLYLILNALGAAIAACASWGIGFMPFVVLEATWCVVALATLAKQMINRAA